MSALEEWLDSEDRKENFGIDLFDLRRNDTIERGDDGKRSIRTVVSAKGKFRKPLMRARVGLDDRDIEFANLPILADIHFQAIEEYARISEPLGLLTYFSETNDEGDTLTLQLLLPETWLSRFTDKAKPVWLVFRVDGLYRNEKEGKFEKIWKIVEKRHLMVIECAVKDKEVHEDATEMHDSIAEDSELDILKQMNASLAALPALFERQITYFAVGAVAIVLALIFTRVGSP